MATKTNKKRQTQEQKLRDAVAYAASCLKEAGDPLHNLGPSQQYADAFGRYSEALHKLAAHVCGLHMGEWHWDGYKGNFCFRWELSAQLAQPTATYEHDTRFLEMSCPAELDASQPLGDELTRLRAEAAHYSELCGVALRWASAARAKALGKESA